MSLIQIRPQKHFWGLTLNQHVPPSQNNQLIQGHTLKMKIELVFNLMTKSYFCLQP